MSAEELSLFSEPENDEVYFGQPGSPEIPLQNVAGISSSGASRRKRGPGQRVIDSSSSDTESDCDADGYMNNTPKRPGSNIISRPPSVTTTESLLFEMKEMLCKMSKKVDRNERALKELKDNSVT